MKIYTGIGKRNIPVEIANKMENLAKILARFSYILRSGGANGSDSAFERGCTSVNGKKEIYLPFKGFNGSSSDLYKITDEALETAKFFHPGWNRLSNAGKLLHARNCYQVLGYDLKTPTEFIVCYADGSGGTEQALRIAKHYKIKTFNMNTENWLEDFLEFFSNKTLFN